jgi:hypothetical protein
MADASLAAHDRRHSDDVVRIGRVPHAQKEAERNNREQCDHLFSNRGRGAKVNAAAFKKLQILGHSFTRFGQQFENLHAWPHRLDVASRGRFVKFYGRGEIRFCDNGNVCAVENRRDPIREKAPARILTNSLHFRHVLRSSRPGKFVISISKPW